jgi:hypothetical protein
MGMVVDMLAQLAAQKRVTGQDVLAARAVIYSDMAVDPNEAEALFRINDAVVDDCREWRELFIEAMTDYVVRQQEPRGYIDDGKAGWLEDWILADGKVRGETELELLIYILEQAEQAPVGLFRLAIHHVRDQALAPERVSGDGPTLTAEEIDQIRRLLYAFAGSGGGASISRDEAEVLFELNDAARGRPNDPSWTELFSRAIGASILAASGHRAVERDEALRREAWLRAPTEGVGSFYARMLRSLAKPDLFGRRDAADDAVLWASHAAHEAASRAAAPVSEDEAGWLASRIGRDGALDENEVALLQFVAGEAQDIHPALAPLIQQARAQAGPAFGRRAHG